MKIKQDLTANKLVIVFDFDGTLANTIGAFEKIFNKLAMQFKLPVLTKEEILLLRESRPQEILKRLGLTGLRLFKLPLIVWAGRREIAKEIDQFKTFNGINAVLKELKKNHKVGIVTSNSVKNVERFLKNNDLNYFDFIYSVGLFNKSNQLKKLIDKFKLTPEDIIYVGDEIRDIEAARKNGMKVISVSWGLNSKKALEKSMPDYLADTPDQLLKFIRNQPPF